MQHQQTVRTTKKPLIATVVGTNPAKTSKMTTETPTTATAATQTGKMAMPTTEKMKAALMKTADLYGHSDDDAGNDTQAD